MVSQLGDRVATARNMEQYYAIWEAALSRQGLAPESVLNLLHGLAWLLRLKKGRAGVTADLLVEHHTLRDEDVFHYALIKSAVAADHRGVDDLLNF